MDDESDIKQKAGRILRLLDIHYPDETRCHLRYGSPHELLFSTILSAQCTDERVNEVTGRLFKRYQTLEDFAGCDIGELEDYIRSVGLYHSKAQAIRSSARMLIDDYGGAVPGELSALTALPGVGRKTANLILGQIFGIPAVVVDTHVRRVSNRLGLTASADPQKIELELMEILPEEHWIRYNTQIVAHGRGVCKARWPECGRCFLSGLCGSRPNEPREINQ